MDELRRIRATFDRYCSLRGNGLFALLGGAGVVGMLGGNADAIQREIERRGQTVDLMALGLVPGLLVLLCAGVLYWLGRAPQGRVIDLAWRSSEPGQGELLFAGALLLTILGIALPLRAAELPQPVIYGVAAALLAGALLAFLIRRYGEPLAALLCAVAVALPAGYAALTGGRYQPFERAFYDGIVIAGFVYGSFGSVYLRRLLRPLSRPAFDALQQADLPPALRSPDALAVLAALAGCRAASPLLLQRLSHGAIDQVLSELEDAGLAEADGPRDDLQRGMAGATAAGRQTIAALIG